jgi:hypothetical protein
MCVRPMYGESYIDHINTVVFLVSVSASGRSVILVCCNHDDDELAVPSATARTNNWRPHCDNRGRCIHGVTLETYT